MDLVPIGFVSLVMAYAAAFIAFTGPGYMVASALQLPLRLTREQRLSVVLLVAGLVAYGFFCLEWLRPSAVAPVAMGLAIVVPFALLAHLMARWPVVRFGGTRWIGAPLSIAFLVGLLYLALLSAPGTSDGSDVAGLLFFEAARGIDRVASPIRAGVAIWLAPLGALVEQGAADQGATDQAIAVVLQVMAIPALWMIARLLPLGGSRVRFALLLIVATGFTFFNAIQLGPKLLAAAYFLVAARPFLTAWARRATMTRTDVIIAALALALALMVDGVTVFAGIALLALALLFVLPWRVRPVDLVAGAVAAVLVCAPWYFHAEKTSQSAPGSLIRHLAGDRQAGDTPGWQAVRRAYSDWDRDTWIDGRVTNVERLFRDADIDRELVRQAQALGPERKGAASRRTAPSAPAASTPEIDPSALSLGAGSFFTVLRIDQREVFFRALWVLNLGWLLFLAAPAGILASSARRRGEAGLMLVWVAGLAVWVGLLLEPGSTRLVQAPYALVLMAMLLAAGRLSMLPPVWRGALLLLHAGSGIIIWLATLPGPAAAGAASFEAGWQVVPLAVAAVTGLILAGLAVREPG